MAAGAGNRPAKLLKAASRVEPEISHIFSEHKSRQLLFQWLAISLRLVSKRKDSGLTGLLPAAKQPADSRAFCPQLGYKDALPKTLEMVLRILRRG